MEIEEEVAVQYDHVPRQDRPRPIEDAEGWDQVVETVWVPQVHGDKQQAHDDDRDGHELAKEHHLPFYVAAPLSTIDRATLTGADIPIEQRPGDEVRLVGSQRIASPDVEVANPAFDVTPARYIRGIITEVGVAMPPNEGTIAALFAGR